jgi:hypothetical protein
MTPYVITLHREGMLRRSKMVLLKLGTRILAQIKEIVVGVMTELYGQGYTVCYTFIVHWNLLPKGGTFYAVKKVLESGIPVINIYKRIK